MADTATQECPASAIDKQQMAAWLEPYRGKKGKLGAEEGATGLSILWTLFQGNATWAAEFLCCDDKIVREQWAKVGLRAQGKCHGAIGEGETVADIRARYLQVTSERERAPVIEWRLPPGDEHGVCVCVSDLHYGPREMDYERWLKLRDWIKANPAVRWMYLGDGLNTKTKNAPGGPDYLNHEEAERLLEDDFRSIADQCLIILSGNHEGRVARETGLNLLDPMGRIAEHLEVHYGKRNCFLRLRVLQGRHKQEYDGYVHHGFGSAGTPGGKINYLFKTIANLDVDFLAMGHVHAREVAEQIRMTIGRSSQVDEETGTEYAEVGMNEKVMVFAGSFLKYQQGSYGRDWGLSPAALGATSLHFYGSRKTVHGRK